MPNHTKSSSTPNTHPRPAPPEQQERPGHTVRQPPRAARSAEPLAPFPRTPQADPHDPRLAMRQQTTERRQAEPSERLVAQPYQQPSTTTEKRAGTQTERGERLVAQPYQRPLVQDHRQQLRRFVDNSPTGWVHFVAHKIALVIQPLFAATLFLVNLALQVAWEIVRLGASFMPHDSQRRIRRMHSPMLHPDSPAAMIVFAALLLFGIGFITQPFLLPEPTDPRSFAYSERPAWQRIADPSKAFNLFESAVAAVAGAVTIPEPAVEEQADDSFAKPLLQRTPGDHNIQGTPSISPEQIDRILESYGSPATGTGQAWYDLGVQYNIDPAYAVAFFIHESSAGTNPAWAGWKDYGSRASTHNVGNIICAGYPTCYGRFRDYPSWEAGIEDWYRLISVEYIQGRGTVTVAQIIPIYAPSFENDVGAYVGAVERLVDGWRIQGVP